MSAQLGNSLSTIRVRKVDQCGSTGVLSVMAMFHHPRDSPSCKVPSIAFE
jgi:hypothetical protein